ncbi:MAG TPA: zf-TFIIB domain-containing protein [Phycisphaerae bacterium]|nr:zf-TFIIB domain-containing protein [Phycisphaerae bacterium]
MCPRCREPLVAYELEGIEIDRCIGCGGTWLDAGELEWIAEKAGVDPGPLSQALHAARRRGKRTDLKCPRCGHKMQEVIVGDEPGVELDRCRYKHGLWFDPGEMQKVIASVAGGEPGAIGRFFSDLYRHDVRSESEGG